MSKTKTHRCTECKQSFNPDPRTKTRQVTCGRNACQRSRHAEQCRLGRQRNPEAASHHYEDYVIPFRKRRPEYQRYWRWLRKLREIREEMAGSVERHLPRLTCLLDGGRAWACTGDGDATIAQVQAKTEETIASLLRIAALIQRWVAQLSARRGERSEANGPPSHEAEVEIREEIGFLFEET